MIPLAPVGRRTTGARGITPYLYHTHKNHGIRVGHTHILFQRYPPVYRSIFLEWNAYEVYETWKRPLLRYVRVTLPTILHGFSR